MSEHLLDNLASYSRHCEAEGYYGSAATMNEAAQAIIVLQSELAAARKALEEIEQTTIDHVAVKIARAALNAKPVPATAVLELQTEALRLLKAEDARQSKLHDLLETIREQIRTEVPVQHRPEGLFKNIQDAVYAMRGRTLLMNDRAITAALSSKEPEGER